MASAGLVICMFLVLGIVKRGLANPCVTCISHGEERICDESGETLECTENLAEKYMEIFMSLNKDLDVSTADKTRYKCFKFSFEGGEPMHLKGCTYESLRICQNMGVDMICEECTGSNCNGVYFEHYYDDSGHVGTLKSSITLTAASASFIGVLYFTTRY